MITMTFQINLVMVWHSNKTGLPSMDNQVQLYISLTILEFICLM